LFKHLAVHTSIPIVDVNLGALEDRHKSVDEEVLVAGTELDGLE